MSDPAAVSGSVQRRTELGEALAAVRERINRACVAADREPAGITLIAVTKFFPATDIALLHELGIRHVGENRDQDAAPKIALLDRAVRARLTVHFIGQLQSNKTGHVVKYADCVQSIDRGKLVGALDRSAQAADRHLDVLVQVDLGQDSAAGRGGADPDDVPQLCDQVAEAEALRLTGLMAVAPQDADPAAAFARLRELADVIRADHPGAERLSAGMSGDLEQAVAAGATHLRVGSAILGSRPPRR